MIYKALLVTFFVLALTGSNRLNAQNPVNWTQGQLVEPAQLANTLKTGQHLPVIISIGPGATIPNSIDIGMVNKPENLQKFEDTLKTFQKNQDIVIYCGCCPFEHCPNVRPAINVLKEMKFTNYHLLNLPNNIRKDWIDKGYPAAN